MKIPVINNNCNTSHKAYFEPNTNFQYLFYHHHKTSRNVINPKLALEIKKLPEHNIEIFKLNNVKNSFHELNILDDTECLILNKTTNQMKKLKIFNAMMLEDLFQKIVNLKDTAFFKEKRAMNFDSMDYYLTTKENILPDKEHLFEQMRNMQSWDVREFYSSLTNKGPMNRLLEKAIESI